MVKYNIPYEEVINRINGKESELVKSFVSKFASPRNVRAKKEATSCTLTWGLGSIDGRFIIKKEGENEVSFTYIKEYKIILIIMSVLALVRGLVVGWTINKFVFFGLIAWVGFPIFISLQESYLSKKYAERMLEYLGLDESPSIN